MEKVLGLCSGLVDGTLFVHVHKFLLSDLLVEILIELPNHAIDLRLKHLYIHLGQHRIYVCCREVFALVAGG